MPEASSCDGPQSHPQHPPHRQSLLPSRLKGPYDALVIGSGIGGLTTASLLSELGWKVAVLEQHCTAGGNTHSYERAGYD